MMIRFAARRAMAAVLLLLAVASPVRAQGTLNDVIAFLMTNQAVPSADFDRDRAAAVACRSQRPSSRARVRP